MSVLGVGPQVNKFEQVSSDDHEMSVTGKGVGLGKGEERGVGSMSCMGGGEGLGLMSHEFLPSATVVVGKGYVFTCICLSTEGGVHPPGQPLPRQTSPPGKTPPYWVGTPIGRPPKMATAVDSMHPTGMHSCFEIMLILVAEALLRENKGIQ